MNKPKRIIAAVRALLKAQREFRAAVVEEFPVGSTVAWRHGMHQRIGTVKYVTAFRGGALFDCRTIWATEVEDFIAKLSTGLGVVAPSPIISLRERFIDLAKSRIAALKYFYQMGLVANAFNKVLLGQTSPPRWRNTGPTAEAFPPVLTREFVSKRLQTGSVDPDELEDSE